MKRNTTSRKKRNNIIPDDLDKLLQQTENITLDDAEFNKLFNEQEQILCDIKSILSNGSIKDTMNCENKIKNKLHTKKYLNQYNTFKQNYYNSNINLSPNAMLKGAVIMKKPSKTNKHLPHKKLVILQKV